MRARVAFRALRHATTHLKCLEVVSNLCFKKISAGYMIRNCTSYFKCREGLLIPSSRIVTAYLSDVGHNAELYTHASSAQVG